MMMQLGDCLHCATTEYTDGMKHGLVKTLIFGTVHFIVIECAVAHAKARFVIEKPENGRRVAVSEIVDVLVGPDGALCGFVVANNALLEVGHSEII